MGEWKRVLLDPKRIFLLALMTLICAGLFVLSLLNEVGPKGLSTMQEASAYAEGLVKRWEGADFETLSARVDEELRRLWEFDYWYYDYTWYELPFETEEDAYASIADLPVLLDAVRSGDSGAYNSLSTAYQSALMTMRDEIDYLTGSAD